MTRKRCKLGVGLFILVLTMAFLGACGKQTEDNLDSQTNQEVQNDQQTADDQEDATINQGPTEVPIYSINDNSLESEQTYVTIKELTPEAVVQAVVDSFEEHSLEVGIDSVTAEGDTVIVSFMYGTAPLTSVGSTVEETILNSIADSLLDNIESCKKVVFRAEGEAYESGHYAFGIDEVYAAE